MDEPPRPELRIGDRERRAVDAHLQQAHADGVLTLSEYDERAAQCWAARTQSDLDELVRDLPPYRPGPDEEPTVAVAAPESAPAPTEKSLGQRIGGSLVGVAAIGALIFVGSHVVTADDGAAIFGNRQITVAPGQERVEVGMLFGSVDVVVPDGVRARPTGAVIFGSTDCALACTGQGTEVVVDATGAFGSVDILRPGEPEPDDDDDD
ncbi:DUF1707 SHOCT-like domain-containing protein [Pseudonocardia adelaidensis]|uniref:DUF1707 domain-containing protein n=1 Tax=Pseudonocardia adelaidensis TaxID=648754 RepID=A0ABP9NQU2_9PSEU